MRDFRQLLNRQWNTGHFLCVGLDSEYEKMPACVKETVGADMSIEESIIAFNRAIIDATKDLVCAYKPNTAFYEAYGVAGVSALQRTMEYIHEVAPDVLTIIDAKRADIGNTNIGYAKFVFDVLRGDAVTMQPYMGGEALEPLFARTEKGIFILCRTSNPSAGEIQELDVDGIPLYQHVARLTVEKWNAAGNCGLVVGATVPDEVKAVRAIAPDMPFLIPGIGAQGGNLAATVTAARDARGHGFIISASRSVIFASAGVDFAQRARHEVELLNQQIADVPRS